MSQALVRGIPCRPVDSPQKGPVTPAWLHSIPDLPPPTGIGCIVGHIHIGFVHCIPYSDVTWTPWHFNSFVPAKIHKTTKLCIHGPVWWNSIGCQSPLNSHHTRPIIREKTLASNDIIGEGMVILNYHDDVIKWKHFPRYWPFVRGIHRSPVNSPHNDLWRGALMFSLISVWINGWVNNREAGDLRHYCAHYDVIAMMTNYTELYLNQKNGSHVSSPMLRSHQLKPSNWHTRLIDIIWADCCHHTPSKWCLVYWLDKSYQVS